MCPEWQAAKKQWRRARGRAYSPSRIATGPARSRGRQPTEGSKLGLPELSLPYTTASNTGHQPQAPTDLRKQAKSRTR